MNIVLGTKNAHKEGDPMSMKSPSAGFLVKSLLAAVAGLLPVTSWSEWGLNLPPPSTPIASRILELHNAIMVVCLIIFVVVFGVMFYSLYAHRKSRGHQARQFSHNTTVEVIWTVIPFLILVGMAIPSTATLLFMEDTTESDLTVKVTAYQWKWHYDYMEHEVDFFSNLSTPRSQIENREPKGENYLLEVDNPVVIPANRKVRFLLASNDVIHAWWVPKFGVKKDAVPGFVNEFWTLVDEPGTYRGQCAELCGKDHGFMPIVAEVLAPEEFDQWLADRQQVAAVAEDEADRTWSMDELMARGEQVYINCLACHGDQGQGVPPTFPPLTGSPVTTGPIEAHIEIVMEGKPGTTMVPFKLQLSDADIASVITYERNALGNSVGDMVQPSQIKALR